MEAKIKTPTNTAAMVEKASAAPVAKKPDAKQSIMSIMNNVLDGDGYRKRFNDLLGERTPQFVSSIVSMVNASDKLKEAFISAPETVVQSALKAATYDLPIDPTLGFAYIVPFKNKNKNFRMEASFIPGYKGLLQLAYRSGAYQKINAIELREGELKRYDPLTEDIEYEFFDEETREALPVIGYVAYYRLINGMEKYVYMSVKQIEAHERKHRKGQYKSPLWNTDFDAMALKTVLRRLIGKWGIMSVQYQTNNTQAAAAAADALHANIDDDYSIIEGTFAEDDTATPEEGAAE